MKVVDSVEIIRDYASFGPTTWRVPKGSRILGVGLHNGRAFLFAERTFHVTDAPVQYEGRTFEVAHDGFPVSNGARWVGCVSQGSALMWHVYESAPTSGRASDVTPQGGAAQEPK